MVCHNRIDGTVLHQVLCMGQGILYYHSGGAQAVTCCDRIITGHLESGLLQ